MTAIESCVYCGGVAHKDIESCPRISAIEYFKDGVTVRRVEFFAPGMPSAVLSRDGFTYESVIAGAQS